MCVGVRGELHVCDVICNDIYLRQMQTRQRQSVLLSQQSSKYIKLFVFVSVHVSLWKISPILQTKRAEQMFQGDFPPTEHWFLQGWVNE